MNIELQRAKLEPTQMTNIKEAASNRAKGDDEISTSCICCKFKPNCEDAIPYYSQAADLYHGATQWKDEIYCREKLAFCFRQTNSPWEEGNEYEKVANLYINNLNDLEGAFKAVQNAHNCYFIKAEYENAIKCLITLSDAYKERDEDELAEKCLKIAYEGSMQVFHVVAAKKDDAYEYVYKALNRYIGVLIGNGKTKEAVKSLETAVNVIEPVEQNKSNTAEVYRLLLVCYVINNDEGLFRDKYEAAQNICVKNSDGKMIRNIERLYDALKVGDDKKFADCMIELNVELHIEICKKLDELIQNKKPKDKIVNQSIPNSDADGHVVVMPDDNYL